MELMVQKILCYVDPVDMMLITLAELRNLDT